ncbi:hypothetical protein JW711_04940 [Candidatus Woesearchaeota archaeon]|nr:hypothetical protein [Candidatus Woesearchaeota archaeon]
MKNAKNIILSGLVAGVAMLIAAMIIDFALRSVFPSITIEYNNAAIFRPMADPLMKFMFVQPFIVGMIMAWIWDSTKKMFGENDVKRAMNFGLVYGLVTLPGMFMSHTSFSISLLMTLSWWISMIIQGVTAGCVFVKMNK